MGEMLELTVSVVLVLVGLINFAPVVGMVSSSAIARAYGMDEPAGDLAVLLRHRAVLFGIVGGFIVLSAFMPTLQVAAVTMAYISMGSYVALVMAAGISNPKLVRIKNIDVVAIALLSIVPIVWVLADRSL